MKREELKKALVNAKTDEEMKKMFEESGVELTEEELEAVSAGFLYFQKLDNKSPCNKFVCVKCGGSGQELYDGVLPSHKCTDGKYHSVSCSECKNEVGTFFCKKW